MKTSNIPQPPLSRQFADDNEFPAAGSSLPMGSISTNVGHTDEDTESDVGRSAGPRGRKSGAKVALDMEELRVV